MESKPLDVRGQKGQKGQLFPENPYYHTRVLAYPYFLAALDDDAFLRAVLGRAKRRSSPR